ncbi:MATE family efflux transporter [Eubacteriales bacterium OttesenSCG-928-N13]|nr:MATE family efflux transporter [Eubacteriales bacterium OttesenSCG-928-N13]
MNRNDYSKGNVKALITRLAMPMIMAQLVNALYNTVDRMFIGRIEGVGGLAMSGVTLAFPIIIIVSAFALLFGMGGAPLTSISRGEGRNDYAERVLGNSFVMLMISGVVLTIAGLLLKGPLLYLFGANTHTISYAEDYLGIYLMGTMFVMVTLGLNPFINAQGFTRVGMASVAIGAVLNVALDPLLIFTFGMGVRGAALATVISQAVSSIWILLFLCSDRAILRIKRENLRINGPILRRTVMLGLSNFTMRCTECAVQIVCNRVAAGFDSTGMYVAVMGIISSIRQISMLLLNGFVQGFMPVVGYNYGAKLYARVRECIKFTTLVCFIFAVICSALILLFPGALVRLFTTDEALIALTIPAVRIYFCGFSFLFMQMAGQQSFVALGKSRQAIFFSLLRKAFIVVPLTLILPRFIGVNGIFWAEVVSDVVGSSACFITFMLTVYRKELMTDPLAP